MLAGYLGGQSKSIYYCLYLLLAITTVLAAIICLAVKTTSLLTIIKTNILLLDANEKRSKRHSKKHSNGHF